MNNIANTTTLWQLLGKCKVVIPILQRDYAQGRVGMKTYVRNSCRQFLLHLTEINN